MISAGRAYRDMLRLSGYVVTAICLGMFPAFSAELPDTVTQSQSLPELSITALKQQDRIRSEAGSATVIGKEELDNLGSPAIKGLSEVVPNFYIPDYGSRITSSIYVRGLGARMDNPAVGLTIDNVSILNKDAFDLDIPDMASVEMLRGPRSALYGRNTMAGLINITTLSPLRFQGWRFGLTIANGNTYRADAGWYHRFSSSSALSVTLNGAYTGGFFRNEYDGQLTDREKSAGLRAKYLWHPGDDLSLQNVAALSLLRQKGYPYMYVETGEISYNDPCRYNRFIFTDGLTLKKYHDSFTASSVTSLQYINDDLLLDQDFLPEPYFTLNQRKHEIAVTEDLTLRSPLSDSPYSWIAGLSGFWKSLHMEAPVTFKDTGIDRLIELHRNESNPAFPIAWDTRSFPLNSDFDTRTFGLSAYHESKLTLGDFILTGALRLEYERATLHYHSYCSTGYGIYRNEHPGEEIPGYADAEQMPFVRHVEIDIDDRGMLTRHFLELLPSLTALWNVPGGTSNIYASIARGSKAGGFNTQMFSEVLQQRLMRIMGIGSEHDIDDIVGYKPEKSWNYEIGAHLDLCSGKIQLDLALFYINCRDQQLTMFPDGTTTGRIMTNAGKTRSFGGEVTADWMVTDRVRLHGSYGYTNARFREFFDGRQDYAGKRLPYVPSNTLYLQTLYTMPIDRPGQSLQFDINLRGTGPIDWNETNTLRQKFYATLGASVSWIRKGLTLRLWGRNLTDTRFHTFYFMSMNHEFLQRGKPLQAGLDLSLEL